jgi:hypothetical protein
LMIPGLRIMDRLKTVRAATTQGARTTQNAQLSTSMT